jgi:Fur family iron response transcriptional regulator
MKTHCLPPSEIQAALRAAGVSPTAQRIAICRFVLCEADHPTAEKVKEWVDQNFPKMSMATVYNTLGILVKAGLLKEIHLPHLESVIYDNNISKHYHFVDEKSGAILDIDESQLELKSRLDPKFQVRDIEVIVRGRRRA